MSKPKRYTAAGSGVVRTDPEGDLVLYVDYLRLLIEVDELKSQPDPLTAYLYSAELAKDDIKRLKSEVERLSQPAVIGGYNLSQYIRMANSETLEFDNGDIFADMTLPERIKYIVESHARLKAEVERLRKHRNTLIELLDKAIEDLNAAKEGKQP